MPTLAIAGDVMLGRMVGEGLPGRDPAEVWGDVLPALRGADARLVNLECAVATAGVRDPSQVFAFRAPPEAIAVLRAAGVDLVTLANNHVLDYGVEAFLETMARLDAGGIAHCGAGVDADAAWTPAELDVGGLRVRVIAFTDNVPQWEATSDGPGVAYCPIAAEGPAWERLVERVRAAADGCDLLVVGAHWGPNMRRTPTPAFQDFARGLLDAGVDLFWGHSAHLFQGIERRDTGLVLYDTGDLVDDYAVDHVERNDLSFVSRVEVGVHAVGDVRLTPVRIRPLETRVERAPALEAAWLQRRIRRLCDPFGTTVLTEEDEVVIPGPVRAG